MDAHSVKLPVRLAIMVSAAVACGLAVFLFWETLGEGRALPGCGAGSACDSVTSSRWSRWGPIPLSGAGATTYLLILLGTVAVGRIDSVPRCRRVWCGLAILALIAAGSALWLIAVQAFVLKEYCPYCMIDHTAGLTTAVLVLWAAPIWRDGVSRVGRAIQLAGPAGLAVGILIAGQLLMEPESHAVVRVNDLPPPLPPGNPPTNASTESPIPPLVTNEVGVSATSTNGPPRRRIALVENRVTLDAYAHPILGSPEAEHVIVDLFCYTCPHCRDLHAQLAEVRRDYGGQLAVIPMTIPLDAECNSLIPKTLSRHTNACVYAAFAWAVWRADPTKFPEYDEWLFVPEQPPPIEQARLEAVRLVGEEAFDLALSDPSKEEAIQQAIKVFKFVGAGSIPKLLLRDTIVVGKTKSTAALIELLQEQQGLPPLTPAGAAVEAGSPP